jgi:hypothetical protein
LTELIEKNSAKCFFRGLAAAGKPKPIWLGSITPGLKLKPSKEREFAGSGRVG